MPTHKGANSGLKVAALVAGMVAVADSVDYMGVLRHGGMKMLFTGCYAQHTLGSFLRIHIRANEGTGYCRVPALDQPGRKGSLSGAPSGEGYDFVDVGETIIEVYDYATQGSGQGPPGAVA